MDARHFDHLARSLSTAGTRRGLLSLLAALPVVGALLAVFEGESEAKKRRKRRKARQRRGKKQKKNRRARQRKQRQKTVTLCHEGQTIRVRKSKRKKHLRHGDTRGACQSPPPPPPGCTGLTPADDLQTAIAAASPGATITLCAGTWTLGTEVSVTQDLTLIGAGAGQTILDGNNAVRVLNIALGVTVRLEALTITKGRSSGGGGGIYSEGDLRLSGVSVTGNSAETGGGIRSSGGNGGVTLEAGSSVTNNTATEEGGGIFNDVDCTLTLRDGSHVSDNTAGVYGGGIFGNLRSMTTLQGGSHMTGNTAEIGGGGMSSTGGTVTLQGGSAIVGNTARRGPGGGIYSRDSGTVTLQTESRVTGNSSDTSGGGIFQEGGTVTLQAGSVVAGNNARFYGGGIRNFGVNGITGITTLEAGSIVGGDDPADANRAVIAGGGIAVDPGCTAHVKAGSRIVGNTARSGGGIFNYSLDPAVVTLDAGALVCNNSPVNAQCDGPYTGACPNPASGICPA